LQWPPLPWVVRSGMVYVALADDNIYLYLAGSVTSKVRVE